MKKTTEESSPYRMLEEMPLDDILQNINKEDSSVPKAIEGALTQIKACTEKYIQVLEAGKHVFYIGAGTSGRLGIVDASELPPTYGLPFDTVIGLIAGGDTAIRKAVEFAEDDTAKGYLDLVENGVSPGDLVMGLTASGTTPYVVSALEKCREHDIYTACITCNTESPAAAASDYPIEVVVGPEFVTGSTRMKAGTAQKLVLNMISSAAMIKLGHVSDNKMIDMQLTNQKLVDRGARILAQRMALHPERAKALLLEFGSVRKVLEVHGRKRG
jgi:N-acetylmuramic acid 6-phosphate etherase